MNAFESALDAGLRACSVKDGSALLVGISGGPDSTALLRGLCSLAAPWRLELHACIVDHGIRPRSQVEDDIAFTRALCRDNGVPLHVAVVPEGRCRERAAREGRSLEDIARDERLRLLRECRSSSGCASIALAHTQDDAVETLLMRVIQGSDAGGLAGIKPVRGPFIRPLLGCTRRDVLDYLGSLSQSWREDATNLDTLILRNRVRSALVPVLDSQFSGWRTGILRLSAKAGLASELIHDQASQMPWKRGGAGFTIPRNAFFGAPPAVRAGSLLELYDSIRGTRSPRVLPWRFIAPVLGPAADVPVSGTVLQGHGVRLVARNNRISWERRIVSRGKKGYFKQVSDDRVIRIPEIGARMGLARASEKWNPEAGEIILLSREIVPPLVLRSRRAGDTIILESGTTSLKELFADWKVSQGDRQALPVLVDRKGVVVVMGGCFGYHDRVRAGAGALQSEGGTERIVVRLSRELEEGT